MKRMKVVNEYDFEVFFLMYVDDVEFLVYLDWKLGEGWVYIEGILGFRIKMGEIIVEVGEIIVVDSCVVVMIMICLGDFIELNVVIYWV